jgi:D-alanine-D-alanine ligase
MPSSWADIPASKNHFISGNVVYQFLDKTKYNGFRIHIFKEKWVYVDANDMNFYR